MYHCFCGKCYRENERDIFIAQTCLHPTPNTAVSFKWFWYRLDFQWIFPFPFKGLKSVKSELL